MSATNLTPDHNALFQKLEALDYWGAYIKNQFFFKVNTKKTRRQAGISIGQAGIDVTEQRRLQAENLPVLFHEYIHFIQETSTMAGIACMLANVRMKSAFLHWLSPDLNSAESLGMAANTSMAQHFAEAKALIDVIDGSGPEVAYRRKIKKILKYTYQMQRTTFPSPANTPDVHDLKIPVIRFEFINTDNGLLQEDELRLGRFSLYEGLAYELDREIDRQTLQLAGINDIAKDSEYTVLRLLANHIYPGVEKRTFLTLAVVALQARACGEAFIRLLFDCRDAEAKGKSQQAFVIELKDATSAQFKAIQADFNDNQDGIADYFTGRQQLHEGYSYLASVIKKNFGERINNPSFEVDLVFDGNFIKILDISPLCDYMYQFTDAMDYRRDFLGTVMPEEISQPMKSLAALDHYFNAHQFYTTQQVEQTNHCCPFYYCCEFGRRLTDANDCYSKPWRIFEKDRQSDQQYCWYGQGVGNAKGFTRPLIT